MSRSGSLWLVTDSRTNIIYTLRTSWGVSRGRDTAGYTICTLRVDGRKVASTRGGGYDMTGTVIGEWLQETFQERLLATPPAHTWCKDPYRPMTRMETHDNYGLTHQVDAQGTPIRAELDGGCGVECMIRLANQIGLSMRRVE